MKTFPSYDHVLCENEECARKETCKRYLTWRKAVEEKYPYPFTVYTPVGSVDNCMMYVKNIGVMNEVSIIINGVKYDAVDYNGDCRYCDLVDRCDRNLDYSLCRYFDLDMRCVFKKVKEE